MAPPSRLAIRLDTLPRDELLKLAADALAELPEGHRLHSHADALVARRKPLPAWCVDGVLLSPDLLPHMFDALSLHHCGAAAACSAWAAEWASQLRRRRYLQPKPRRVLIGARPRDIVEMPDGALCVSDQNVGRLRVLTAQLDVMPDGGAWAPLANLRFGCPCGVQRHEDSLLVVDANVPADEEGHALRLRMSDGMELSRSPELYAPVGFTIAGNLMFVPTVTNISVLDVHTLELRSTIGEFGSAGDCAVCNDELYVTDIDRSGELQVFGIDGQHLRTVEGDFGHPMCIRIRDDRIYLLEDTQAEVDEDETDAGDINESEGRRLLVLELDGTVRQKIDLHGELMDEKNLTFRGDELLISDQEMSTVHVLRFFG